MSTKFNGQEIFTGLAVGIICGILVASAVHPDNLPEVRSPYKGLFGLPFLGAIIGTMSLTFRREKIAALRGVLEADASHLAPAGDHALLAGLIYAPWAVAIVVGFSAWSWSLPSVGVVWGIGHMACAAADKSPTTRDPLLLSGAALVLFSLGLLATWLL